MAQIFNYLYVASAVVLLFGAAIFVHEFGHYWLARLRGLKVLEFAIGFGPKIFGWTKSGIEYTVRWIPAGGYVKLPQMVTSEIIEGSTEEKLPPVSPFSKILVAFAGPAMNVVFAFFIAVLLYVIGLPVLVNPPIVGMVENGSEEATLGIRGGDRVISVNGKAVKSWEDVQMNSIFARTNTIPVVIGRDGKENTYYLTSKTNELGLKLLNLDPVEHPVVNIVNEGEPAARAGLKVGDEFISFGGVPVISQDQLVTLIHKRAGEATTVLVKRGDKKIQLSVTPSGTPGKDEGRIGVMLSGSATMRYELQHPLPWDQLASVWNRTIDTLKALFHSNQTGVGIKDLSGPPGILAMMAAQVNADYRLALNFLVLLNINLAILNLLPIPVLDGGHIMIAIIEKISRRTLNVKFVEYMTTAFAVLLISFILFVSFNDLTRHRPMFRSMFQHSTKIEQSIKSNDTVEPASQK